MVEYSAMTFAMFFLGEYANMILMSAHDGHPVPRWLAATLRPQSAGSVMPGEIWFALKVAFMLFWFVWVRATFPRYRYDQLMRLGWKIFLPLSLIWVVLISGVLIASPAPRRNRIASMFLRHAPPEASS